MQDIKKYAELIKKANIKIKELNKKLEKTQDIAILGYSCRFPGGANSPEEYWKLLCEGFDAVTDVPADRFSVMEYYDPARGKIGKTYTKEASFLQYDIKKFDNNLFEMSEMEATSIDPQHRLLMEVTWEALENAGVDFSSIRGSKTGVYIGLISSEYGMSEVASDSPYKITPYSLMGNYINSAAGRISYFFDFKGPCMAIDTACSSSLSAINEAVVALRTNQCDMAVVGGANLLLTPNGFVGLSQINALSGDGCCRAFDSSASGYGRSEGCGVIVLKRLSDAQKENDNIQAVIKSVSVMHGGKSNGFFAPNGLQEREVMRVALQQSGLSSNDVDYIEAHGTGTVLGDAIESEAIHGVYGERQNDILIGSVKTNLGHMEAAAGMASVIKVLLSLKNGKLPPSIHYDTPNPNCQYPHLQVVDHLIDWRRNDKLRVAGVSSFGISGTLSHMIVQEYRDSERAEQPAYEKEPVLFTLSATTKKSLMAAFQDFDDVFAWDKYSLADIAYASNQTRSAMRCRFAAVVKTKSELRNLLKDCAENEFELIEHYGEEVLNSEDCCVLLSPFTNVDMLEIKRIMATSVSFKNTFMRFDTKFKELCGFSIYDAVYGHTIPSEKDGMLLLQIALHSAYIQMLQSIMPLCGEYKATGISKLALAYAAGVLDFDETTALAVALESGDSVQLNVAIQQINPCKANRDMVSQSTAEMFQNLSVWIHDDLLAQGLVTLNSTWKACIVFGDAVAEEKAIIFNCKCDTFFESLKHLYLLGATINWHRIYDVFLYPLYNQPIFPGYHFIRKTCWNDLVYFGRTTDTQIMDAKDTPEEVVSIENLAQTLIDKAASISGLSPEDVEVDRPLAVYGFDSFSFMMLSSELKQWFKLNVDVKDFYEDLRTIEDICAYVNENIAIEDHDVITQPEKEVSIVQEQDYPMSTMQAHIYTELLLSDVALYDLVGAYYVGNDLDVVKLERCANEQLRRHTVLCAGLFLQSGNFCMHIYSDCSLKIETLAQPKDVSLTSFIRQSLKRFDLAHPPLMEIFLISTVDGKRMMVFHFNHAVSDGISMNLYASELMRMYHGEKLLNPTVQYSDYVLLEQAYLKSDKFIAQRNFWHNSLENVILHLPLPYDFSADSHDLAGSSVLTTIDAQTFNRIRLLCGENGTTPFMFFQAVISILLHRLTHEDHIAVAIPVSCRSNIFMQNVGMFTNTIAVRSHYQREQNFLDVLNETLQYNSRFMDNIDYPFNDLAETLGLSMSNSLNVMYVYENVNSRTNFGQNGMFEPFNYESETEPFDLNFELMEHDGVVDVHLRYRTALFQKSTIERFSKMLYLVVSQVIETPEIPVGKLDTVLEEERVKILNEFNETALPLVKASIPALFEEQANAHQNDIAIEESGCYLTYAELQADAKCIAGTLRNRGIKHGDIIALSVTPGVDMIKTILGVLYAGAAYLPIDPGCPSERLSYILADSKASLLITNCDTAFSGIEVVSAEKLLQSEFADTLDEVRPDELAYIIYTSGTTGKPKGVMMAHEGVSNLREYFRVYQNVNSDDRVLQFASYAFDATISEFSMSILSGGTLFIVPAEYRNVPEWVADYIEKKKITISVLPPIVLQQLPVEKLRSMRTIITAGSETSKTIVDNYHDIPVYSNDYGPTEATVCATYWKHISGDKVPYRIPIGRPICNKQVYILNGDSLCGIGIKGELCIAGDGIAIGYLGMPELTEQKFVTCPFTGERMYRTGDAARWLPDGNIELLGRLDTQIKLRGYRIELGEIEAVADSVLEIDVCAATIIKDNAGEAAIALYYVSDKELPASDIRFQLSEKLPSYMLPTYYMQLEEIPLNRNGKPDIKKLLAQWTNYQRQYEAPQTELEEKICKLMADVLKMERVGATDNFFEIGGHSLRATLLVNRIEETLGVKLSQKVIYSAPSPRKIATMLETNSVEAHEEFPRAVESDYYEMSFAQKRIYSVVSISPDRTAYNMPQILRLSGNVDIERIRKVVQEIVDSHSILRTCFRVVDGTPRQFVISGLKIDIPVLEDNGEPVQKRMETFVRAFDLSQVPLLRIELIQSENCVYMLADFHHIICDGMSLLNFSREFVQLYNGETPAQQKVQYVDYCEWMSTRDLDSQGSYWREVFADRPEQLNLQTDLQRPAEMSYCGSCYSCMMPQTEVQRLEKFAQQAGTTPFVIVLSILMVLMQRYSGGKDDIVIGTPISGRTRRETENMLGMFVNILAMRGNPKNDMRFTDFIDEMNRRCLDAYENQEYPFEQLVRDLSLGVDMSHNSLFDVMLAFQNNEQLDENLEDVQVGTIAFEQNVSKFDLTWNIEKKNGAYVIELEYSTDLFFKETVQRMAKHFLYLTKIILDNPEAKLDSYELILPEERVVLQEMNQTQTAFPQVTIQALLEQQAQLHADADAVIYRNQSVSFKRLNETANALAEHLLDCGIGRGDFVAIMADRSIEFFVAVFAVLKAGAAYVPVDPGLPEDRIQYILSDCKPKRILTYCNINVPYEDALVEKMEPLEKWESSQTNPDVGSDVHDVAYCIYTSGTTGKPKGVLIEHIGVSNLREYFVQKQELGVGDHTLQFANYSFDASVSEMAMGILTGACMYLVPEDARNNYDSMHAFLTENGITAAILPPQYVRNLDVSGLHLVISAGAESDKEIAMHCSASKVYSNDYGPTEVTVCATYWKHFSEEQIPQKIPIGKPINNKQIYVMNGITLCGCNIPGELCIGGVGLAKGYLGQKELTAQKFILHPVTGERLYRSGDLARLLPDGNIEFLGRIDKQVKVCGYRIELNEIEYAILNQDGVEDCTVLVRKNDSGENQIVAYVVSNESVDRNEMNQLLARTLPEYMLPAYYVAIDQIPYNRSGKVDEHALPAPEANKADYREPQNEIEAALCSIFENVLNVSHIGCDDSFFELGGDSIKAIKVVSVMSEKGYHLTYRDLMFHKTAAAIATTVTKEVSNTYDFDEVNGVVKDTPMIRQFQKWNLKNPEYFDQSVLLRMEADSEPYLQEALHALVIHHDILRSIWTEEGLSIRPADCNRQLEFYKYILSEESTLREDIIERCSAIQKSFELEKGPLFKSACFRTPDGLFLLLCAHHLVIDRLSWNILVGDLQQCIESISNGEELHLPPKTASLLHWENYLKEYSATERCLSQKQRWNAVNEAIANWKFPEDGDPVKQSRASSSLVIDEQLTNNLLFSADKAYGTETHELLLAALATAVRRTAGLNKMAIVIESNGRQELHHPINLTRSIGWFTNTYPVLIPCEDTIEQAIVSAKDAMREIQDSGMAYSVCFGEKNSTENCISFNYLGRLDQDAHYSDISSELHQNDILVNNNIFSNIDLNGKVSGGHLILILSFELSKYKPETMQKLMVATEEALREIIALCESTDTRHATRTDIAEAGIEQAEFNEIIGLDFG